MSAEITVRAAMIAALKQDMTLMDGLNGLFDGAPDRATSPYAAVEECLGADWGAKDVDGRELRLSISLHDMGETPARIAPLLARVDAVVKAMTEAGEGWRIVTTQLLRSRIARQSGRDRGWRAIADYRLRLVREAG
ncbi:MULTISPECIES: DUF3168 domain-containing protein [Sphingobium]|uniref:DUF3168 domain-containing protein n=1 Tax=Sphingobium baderi TaxID=1332080 RepID=A0A0S3F2B6_9SPHN|nr:MULTISPECIES: DUF3168 domain-containing protein [Sphingobium]ALR21779.1 hypothetical protein ATN00_17215 [Sphingobium baderi]